MARDRSLPPVITKLKAWRALNKLSQSQAVRKLVASGLPIKLRTLQTWEIGQSFPQPVTAAALERFFTERHETSKSRRPPAPVVLRLKAWRDGNGLSQAEAVAALVSSGVPAKLATLQQWETGRLLPQGADHCVHRYCESLFIHAPFHKRCKPGLSHWGLGLELRQASAEACAQFGRALPSSALKNRDTVCYDGPIVEAFPNAFLGVLMSEVELLSAPKLKRGRRFDWLYEQVVATGRLESMFSQDLEMPDEFWLRLRSERNHELRAALICLLTAAFAAQGTAATIGDSIGGWFWLPPWSSWQPWATQGLESAVKKMAVKSSAAIVPPVLAGSDKDVYRRRRGYPAFPPIARRVYV